MVAPNTLQEAIIEYSKKFKSQFFLATDVGTRRDQSTINARIVIRGIAPTVGLER